MRELLLAFFIFLASVAGGQDTIRIMHYNLLNYGNNYGDCNSSNNNVDDKNESLKIIVEYLQPDILTVNEMDDNNYYHDYLLNNVFHINGFSNFKRGNPPNFSNSPIMNEIFYDSKKFTLVSNAVVETNYRDIDIFSFLFNGSEYQDSIMLNCTVAHLKAGNDPEDAQERASETNKLMNYLSDNNLSGNFLLSGDLNLYSGSESAFQNLLLYSDENIRFFDPINQIGEWHNNNFFAPIHTQSTHTSDDCPAEGGMDDRFDFILVSEEILEGTDNVNYVSSSYAATGQDGLRLNQSLVSPVNNSVPPDVLSALYSLSDHLPVILDLEMSNETGAAHETHNPIQLTLKNPVKDFIHLTITSPEMLKAEVNLLDVCGRSQFFEKYNLLSMQNIQIPVTHLNRGIYFLIIIIPGENPIIKKLVISN